MSSVPITSMAAGEELEGGELIEVSQPSPDVTITATTISAVNSDQSFNDSGSGFLTAGFTLGDRVGVSGFTTELTTNIFAGVITALTSAKMTIGGTDGEGIGDVSAGDTVTITKWVTRRTTAQEIADLAAAGISEAPNDGDYYARRNEAWEAFEPGGSPGPYFAEVITVSGTSDNLDPADAGKFQRWTSGSAKTLTVQNNATEAQTVGDEWHIRNTNASILTLDEDTSVTINPPAGGTLEVPVGGTVTLKCVATDEYDLLGQTVPA